jgi:hypothetical protein
MASLTNATAASILDLIFNATTWTSIAINATSSPATNLYVSLHNADPGETGSQTTSETAYTNYARVAVVRTSSGFTESGTNPEQVANTATITFPQCGATGDTLTYWGLGLSSSGAGTLLMSGPIGPANSSYGFTATLASPGVLTVVGSALTANERVMVYGVGPALVLPTGLTEGTVYYVGTVTGTAVTLSTTTANANPVNTSATGSGVLIACAPLVVSNNITPSFAASSLVISLD